MPCHPSHGTTGKDTRSVRRQHVWAPFQAPWEEDPGPGFQQFKIEQASAPSPKPPSEATGIDSGVKCFQCGQDTLRIVDHRTEEEVLASLPDEQYRRSQGRGDPRSTPEVLMLICPRCKSRYQLRREVVDRKRNENS